jgi:hypothetical protein
MLLWKKSLLDCSIFIKTFFHSVRELCYEIECCQHFTEKNFYLHNYKNGRIHKYARAIDVERREANYPGCVKINMDVIYLGDFNVLIIWFRQWKVIKLITLCLERKRHSAYVHKTIMYLISWNRNACWISRNSLFPFETSTGFTQYLIRNHVWSHMCFISRFPSKS